MHSMPTFFLNRSKKHIRIEAGMFNLKLCKGYTQVIIVTGNIR